MRNRKPFIFLCDDKEKWTGLFKYRHGGELTEREIEEVAKLIKDDTEQIRKHIANREEKFKVKTINVAKKFESTLKGLKKRPDVILIDLYHPKTENMDVKKIGDEKIKELEKTIEKTRGAITDAWTPTGLDLLYTARKECPNTPIVVYTERGLAYAGNRELGKVSHENAEWMIKELLTDCGEEKMLKRILETKRAETTKRIFGFIRFICPFIMFLVFSLLTDKINGVSLKWPASTKLWLPILASLLLTTFVTILMPHIISLIKNNFDLDYTSLSGPPIS